MDPLNGVEINPPPADVKILLLHGGVEVGLAGDECPDRVFDFLGGRVLCQVATGTGLQGWEEELVVGVGCQHQHACVGE